jgi:hypothetical protein
MSTGAILRTVVVLLLLNSAPAGASGAGGARMPIPGVMGVAGSREWVRVEASNGLLVGRPTSAAIDRITILAPGITTAHVIVREQGTDAGERLLGISAPPGLAARAERVVLFLRATPLPVQVSEYADDAWHLRGAHSLRVGDDNPLMSREHVLAVSLQGFNPVRLVTAPQSGDPMRTGSAPSRSFTGFPTDGVARGVLPWLCAACLLTAALQVSRWAHRHAA